MFSTNREEDLAGLEGWEGEQWELRSEGKEVDLVRILEKCRDLPLLCMRSAIGGF